MKVGIFSPYFNTYGGGERYVLSVAEYFLLSGNQVDIYQAKDLEKSKVKEFFGIDISGANLIPGAKSTFGYDWFFFLSDGSIPFTFAKRNILHFQTPFKYKNQKTLQNRFKLSRFSKIVCNSGFTKKFVDQTYGVNSIVLYPPVDVERFKPGKKENLILSVGRFTSPTHANSKKQEILIKMFKKLDMAGWRLVLIGAGNGEELKPLIGDAQVEIISNGNFATLQNYYARAKIYWHAAGFGEDLENHPDRAEHFGITVVEAMASGCVPVVFDGGGLTEIVIDGQNGFRWGNMDEFKQKTLKIVNNDKFRRQISNEAQKRSENFSKQRFFWNLEQLCV